MPTTPKPGTSSRHPEHAPRGLPDSRISHRLLHSAAFGDAEAQAGAGTPPPGSPRTPPLLFAGLAGAVGLLGVIDYSTGHELNFFVFYFLPVSFAAFRLGLWPAIAFSVLCSAIWGVADIASGHTYSHPAFAVWNTLVRLSSFLTIGWAVARIRDLLIEERTLSERLHQALATVELFEGILPVCAYCKKIRDEAGAWQQMEHYIHRHSGTEFTHGICPECMRRVLAEAGIPAAPEEDPAARNPGP